MKDKFPEMQNPNSLLHSAISSLPHGCRYAIFGTGELAHHEFHQTPAESLQAEQRSFVGFIDREAKGKDLFFDYPLYHESNIGSLNLDRIIVISDYDREIISRLKKSGFDGDACLSVIDFNALFRSFKQKNLCDFKESLEKLDLDSEILLVNPASWEVRFPNVGLGYLDEELRKRGFKVKTFDLNNMLLQHLDLPTQELWQPRYYGLWSNPPKSARVLEFLDDFIDTSAVKIADAKIPYVGISVSMFSRIFSVELAERIKTYSPDTKIIFGGFEIHSLEGCKTFPNVVDAFVIGEGERSLPELLNFFNNGSKDKELPGVCLPDRDLPIQPFLPVEHLDSLQFPRYPDLCLQKFMVTQEERLMVCASRGCSWNRCSFCVDSLRTPGTRIRSPENVLDEIRYHYDHNGINGFVFSDETINMDLDFLDRFSELIIRSGIKITLNGQARIRKGMSPELLRKMRKAGYTYILYGLESGSDRIIRDMRKGFHMKLAEQVFKDTHDAGIMVGINIIVGFPTETEKEFAETVKFLEKNASYITNIEVLEQCQILKGADVYENYEKYKVCNRDDPHGWETLDGKNNFQVRAKRKKTVEVLAKDIGIKRGYLGSRYYFKEK